MCLWHNPRDFLLPPKGIRGKEGRGAMAARLGDIIDDYCSRCRLLTNHSIAAIVGDEIKKVVCRTCQHSHDYKHGKGAEKKRNPKESAYEQVLASVLAGKSMEAKPSVAQPPRPSRSLGRSRMRTASGRGSRTPRH
jgi:hypothetical protein